MSGNQVSVGQVLGAATTLGAGVAMLPDTGSTLVSYILPVVSIACGLLILGSLAVTSLMKKKIAKA